MTAPATIAQHSAHELPGLSRRPALIRESHAAGTGRPPVVEPAGPRAVALTSIAERPELRATLEAVDAVAYPAFMQHTDLSPLWPAIYAAFPEYQLVLVEAETGRHLAHGNMVPLAWDGDSAHLPQSATEMVHAALRPRARLASPTAFGALQAVVDPAEQGTGLSVRMLQEMARLASTRGASDLVAPIRPTYKARYPLATLERYVTWMRPDGLPVDLWQRAHVRLGATPAGIVERWLTVTAPIAAWSDWTGLHFSESGTYVVPGALVPIAVDLAAGVGEYVEPHLWMRYRLAPPAGEHAASA